MKTKEFYLRFWLLGLFCLLLPWNMFAGDPFKVTVTETTNGGPTGGGGDLCFNSQYVPCFTYNDDGTVSATFDMTFIFDPSRNIPDGVPFQSKGLVYEIVNGNQSILPLSNGVSGQSYAHGTIGVSNNNRVDVMVTLDFVTTTSCDYYFTFWIDQIYTIFSYRGNQGATTRTGGNSNVQSNIVGPGNPTFPNLNLPNLEATTFLTTCDASCRVIYDPMERPLCPDEIDDNNDHLRVGQESKASLDVYPNPSLDGNIILSTDFGKDANGPMDIRVLNTQGQVVFEKRLTSQLSKQKLSLSDLSPGIYFIYAQSGEKQAFEKIVKQ